jgi:hypothetical protein
MPSAGAPAIVSAAPFVVVVVVVFIFNMIVDVAVLASMPPPIASTVAPTAPATKRGRQRVRPSQSINRSTIIVATTVATLMRPMVTVTVTGVTIIRIFIINVTVTVAAGGITIIAPTAARFVIITVTVVVYTTLRN